MGREEIENRLRLPVFNLGLSMLSKKEGDIDKAKTALFDVVARMIWDVSAYPMEYPGDPEGLLG